MTCRSPPIRFFNSDTTESITPQLGDGWVNLTDGVVCRPWMVHVFNLRLDDFCGCPGSLADLAYANPNGEPLEDARDLGALLGMLLTLPSETKLSPAKGSPTVSCTFKQRDRKLQKTQLVLEPLRSPFEPYHVVGLRLHVFLYEAVTPEGVFPFLTSNTWMRLIAQNSAQKLKEAQKTRPPPTNQDPAAAWRHVASVATLGKCWYSVLGDAITGTKKSITDWVYASNTSVSNVTFEESLKRKRGEICLHRLSPEWILRFSSETLVLRTQSEVGAQYLKTSSYFMPGSETYYFPRIHECLVYAGESGAMHAPLPTSLANDLMRAHEEFGGAGQSYGSRVDPKRGVKRRRSNGDLASVNSEDGSSDDE